MTQRLRRATCVACVQCTAGLTVACEVGYFNPTTNADSQTACVPCPAHSTTRGESSTRATDCVCDPGWFNNATGRSADCIVCPSGTDCSEGAVTLESLPLRPGFYRPSRTSIDVRQCPDVVNGNASGCHGGSGAPCRPSLAPWGILCSLCDERNATGHVYYVEASAGKPARCEDCGDRLVGTFGLLLGVVVALLAAAIIATRVKAPELLKHAVRALSPQVKLKILIAFYMIATKVGSVYGVTLPEEVRDFLETMSLTVSFGMQGFATTPLACMGAEGYVPRLLFWMIMPPCVILLIVGAVSLRLVLRRAFDRATLIEQATPWLLRVLFLLYPVITNIAFEAFPVRAHAQGSQGVDGLP